MPRFIDRTGLRYGRLTAVEFVRPQKGSRVRWRCACDCGSELWVVSDALGSKTMSCGCLQADRASEANSTHGNARPGRVSSTYISWRAAKGRCRNPNDKRYPEYGGRGIRMSEAWSGSFETFLADMGEKPEGLTLERLDVNGDYEASNCTWASRKVQAENRRSTVLADGLPLKAFAAREGVPYKPLHYLHRVRKLPLAEAIAELRGRP